MKDLDCITHASRSCAFCEFVLRCLWCLKDGGKRERLVEEAGSMLNVEGARGCSGKVAPDFKAGRHRSQRIMDGCDKAKVGER